MPLWCLLVLVACTATSQVDEHNYLVANISFAQEFVVVKADSLNTGEDTAVTAVVKKKIRKIPRQLGIGGKDVLRPPMMTTTNLKLEPCVA